MSKAYSSNLTQDQWEMLEPLIPVGKTGGRPRVVEMWQVINAILSGLTQLAQLSRCICQILNKVPFVNQLKYSKSLR